MYRSHCRSLLLGMLLGSLVWQPLASAEAVTLPLEVSSPGVQHSVELPYVWDDGWFHTGAYTYNHGLARVAGALMSTVYLQGQYQELTALFRDLGCEMDTLADYHYAAVEPETPDKSGYSFCTKSILVDGRPAALVLVVIRGTSGRQEWLSNANIADSTQTKQEYHEGFAKSAAMIAQDLEAYVNRWGLQQPTTRFLITGHSRGAAIANLLAAFLDRGSYAVGAKETCPELVPKHIYAYTFATPNSCSDLAERTAFRYKNIFNIVNPEDVVPQLPFIKGSWGYGSFGTTFMLPTANNLRGDPERYAKLVEHMQTPFAELTLGRHYTPVPGSEWLARDVKGLQWMAVGSVEAFYGRSRPVNHQGFVRILSGLPEEDDKRDEMYYGGMLKVLARWFPKERAGFEDMHAPATYNAWILSGEPKSIYLHGTPSLVRIVLPPMANSETATRMNRIRVAMGQPAPALPFDLELRIPGGEVVMRLHNGMPEKGWEQSAYPVKNDGQVVSFSVPEEGELEARIFAKDNVKLQVSLGLEANKENGVDALADPLVDKEVVLVKGQQQILRIHNRALKKVSSEAKPATAAAAKQS